MEEGKEGMAVEGDGGEETRRRLKIKLKEEEQRRERERGIEGSGTEKAT